MDPVQKLMMWVAGAFASFVITILLLQGSENTELQKQTAAIAEKALGFERRLGRLEGVFFRDDLRRDKESPSH